ncbi:MAG TPA: type II toxin-antitoxin system Phd/YefM family antitoxin [Myxococcota bacterium]|nr:type II toxin-antitoxin system Phd/YefM family antitoxin [Myxococcota bacterium]HRY96177.1 type II toxin-antitoxin system Phd/YefM family antitoxin [Myxococcota bacterium]
MASTRFSEDIRPLTELKTRTSALVEQVRRSRRPMLLTRRGRGVAVLLDLAEYERLLDRAAFVAAVKEGVQAAEAGDLHPHAAAERILESFGERDGD